MNGPQNAAQRIDRADDNALAARHQPAYAAQSA
nr:MAG TPA: hypothetical protein [Caudoviricetes sp.]